MNAAQTKRQIGTLDAISKKKENKESSQPNQEAAAKRKPPPRAKLRVRPAQANSRANAAASAEQQQSDSGMNSSAFTVNSWDRQRPTGTVVGVEAAMSLPVAQNMADASPMEPIPDIQPSASGTACLRPKR